MSELRPKLIVAAFFAVISALVGLAVVYSRKPDIDPKTFCQKNRTDRSISVIILDQSDKFEKGDIDNAKETTKKILHSLLSDEKLVALEIAPDHPFEPTILFEKCAPKQEAEWNMFFDNVNQLRQQLESFEAAFWRTTDEAFQRKELPKSPILETVSYISGRPDFRAAKTKRLFVFSDLMQHFGKLDFYQSVPEADNASDESIRAEPIALSDTTFYFLLVARRQHWQSRQNLRVFWSQWVALRGAKAEWQFPSSPSSESTR